jgi:hypothetical protein
MDEGKSIRFDIGGAPANDMQAKLRQIDQREWWLWSSAALVILLLMVGIVSFSFSGLFSQADTSYSMSISRAVCGLGVLVILFIGQAFYQQIQINRIRGQLMAQVFAVDKIEVLAK